MFDYQLIYFPVLVIFGQMKYSKYQTSLWIWNYYCCFHLSVSNLHTCKYKIFHSKVLIECLCVFKDFESISDSMSQVENCIPFLPIFVEWFLIDSLLFELLKSDNSHLELHFLIFNFVWNELVCYYVRNFHFIIQVALKVRT